MKIGIFYHLCQIRSTACQIVLLNLILTINKLDACGAGWMICPLVTSWQQPGRELLATIATIATAAARESFSVSTRLLLSYHCIGIMIIHKAFKCTGRCLLYQLICSGGLHLQLTFLIQYAWTRLKIQNKSYTLNVNINNGQKTDH